MEFWNEFASGKENPFPIIRKLTAKRIGHLKARIKEIPTKEEWQVFFEMIEESDFLSGRTRHGFVASFSWVILEENFLKIVEGNYTKRKQELPGGNQAVLEDFINTL